MGQYSALLPALDLPIDGATLAIVVSAPGLLAQGQLEQDIRVVPGSDPEPIRFSFLTRQVGLHVVTVQAYRGGTFLAELQAQVSVEVGAAVVEGIPLTAELGGLAAEPGEVTLQVSRGDDGRYSFQLLSETLYAPELTNRLAGDPTMVVNEIAAELRAMAAGKSAFATPALVRNRLRSLGAQLWSAAVPETIRRQFWEQADRIKIFTIASDRDVLPWELLYPLDQGKADHGFLAEQFPVVRRVYGQGRVSRLPMTSVAYVVPPGSPTNALAEVQAIRNRLGGGVADQGVVERLEELIVLLDAVPGVLHFACHNAFDLTGSSISLTGGPLRPTDLAPAVQQRLMAAASPLVFFNACRTAGEAPWLAEIMGWAKQFVRAGAGAFVGSLWAVRSDAAQMFAEAFYDALVTHRLPLGLASLEARRSIADQAGDPTWLAYTIYGNPAAKAGLPRGES